MQADVEGIVIAREAALDPRWIELGEVRGLRTPRLRLAARAPGELDRWLPGERLRVRARWAPTHPARNPGGETRWRRRLREGPGLSGTLSHPSLAVALPGGREAQRGLHARRRAIAAALAAAGDDSGLLRGLALGDRAALDPALRDAFRKLGLSHVLAVSGLHLVWVAAASFALARHGLARIAPLAARADVRRLALGPALAAALAYAALAGWGVPVRRALWLLAALAASILRGRPGRAGAPLAAAAIWIALGSPSALFDPGAQLSFAVVAALVWSREPRPDRPERPGAETLRRTATAGLAAAPILAWHGGGVSGVALAANALALPALGGLLLPAALAAALAAGLGLPGHAALAGGAAALSEAAVAALAHAASALPEVSRPPVGAAGWLAALALATAGLAARSTAARCAWGLAQAALLAVAPGADYAPPAPRLVALDVGQGDAALVQGRRAALLVDGGGARGDWDAGRSQVVPALRALGVARLDLVIATHGDLDHRGGLPSVLAALPVGELWLPAARARDPAFSALRDAACDAGVPVREVGRGSALRRFGDLRVEPLWPPREGAPSRNAASLVVRVGVRGGHRVLLPGDLDAAAEAALAAREPDLRAEVLWAPHHGSGGSGSALLLDRVAPRLAVVSAGCRNRFGMPHEALRRRLAERSVPLHWTGRDGALRVALRGALIVHGTGPRYDCPRAGASERGAPR